MSPTFHFPNPLPVRQLLIPFRHAAARTALLLSLGLGVAPAAYAQPSLTLLSPARNANGVGTTSNVSLVFSENLKAGSASAVKVFSSRRGGRKSGAAGVADNVINFNPAQDFLPGEVVRVTATTGVQNTGNQPLAAPQVYQFTTAAGVGPGTFAAGSHPAVGESPTSLAVGDLDGDGDLDFVAGNYGAPTVSVRFNNGTGGYGGGADLTVGGINGDSPSGVELADIDGDGDLDILAVIYSFANKVAVRINDGAGHFSAAPDVSTGQVPLAMTTGDVDGDGDIDFVVANLNEQTVNVRLNNGAGTFSNGTDVPVLYSAYDVALADVDGDGDQDMLLTSVPDAMVGIRLNDGTGHFGSTTDVATPYGASKVRTADLDNDGDLDLLTANGFGKSFSVRFNDGNGTFGTISTYAVTDGAVDLQTGDIDGDGDLDVIVSNVNDHTVSVRLNNGSGAFSGTQEVHTNNTPFGLALGDVDGDGDLDMLAACEDADCVSIRLNQPMLPDLVVPNGTTMDIPAGAYHNITVEANATATLVGATSLNGDFVVNPGATLHTACMPLTGPGTFTIKGTATLTICDPAGLTLTANAGAIRVEDVRTYDTETDYVYNGTAAQVTGDGLPAEVLNLTIDNPAGVTLSQNLKINRLLQLTAAAGDLRLANRDLTIYSYYDRRAMVLNAGAGQVRNTGTGVAIVQHYQDDTYYNTGTGGTGDLLGYHHISSPVRATTFADLATPRFVAFTPLVNAAYNALPRPYIAPAQFPNIFGFDERRAPTSSDFAKGYYSPASTADVMTPGRGWSVYSSQYAWSDFRGELNTGTVTLPNLTRTGNFMNASQKSGWHLLGNPYPSPIDWNKVTVPAGMSHSVSVYQPTGPATGMYLVYTNGVGQQYAQLIGIGQGFFARVTSATPVTFSFTDACRPTAFTDATSYRAAPENRPLLTLTLHAAGAPAAQTDEASVYFQADATAGLDDAFDGAKPRHNEGVPTLVSLAGTEELAVNGLPETALAGTTVPLLLDVPAAGTYELAVKNLLNLSGTPVVLVDHLTGTRYDLAGQPTISFAARTAGEDRTRFALEIGQRTTGLVDDAATAELTLFPNPARETVRVGGLPARVAAVQLIDALGRTAGTTAVTEGNTTLDVRGLPAGVYTVRAGAATTRLVVTE